MNETNTLKGYVPEMLNNLFLVKETLKKLKTIVFRVENHIHITLEKMGKVR